MYGDTDSKLINQKDALKAIDTSKEPQFLYESFYPLIEEVVMNSPVILSLNKIANKLNKPRPKIHINSYNIRIHPDKIKILQTILTHFIRNSLDHGIEDSKIRSDIHKSLEGNIYLNFYKKEGLIELDYYDDGAGLDLVKLKNKNLHITDEQKIAEYIFEDGISTKDTISEISGRGIGLSAVK